MQITQTLYKRFAQINVLSKSTHDINIWNQDELATVKRENLLAKTILKVSHGHFQFKYNYVHQHKHYTKGLLK